MDRHRRRLLAALPLAALALPALAAGADDPTRIKADELKKLVDAGQAVIVDVRGQAAYDAEHAKGARHVPLAELSARLDQLPKDKLVVAYCT
ncbi:MAG TPA: rhodanese-like domain-containing protein [Vicinamibacteria bacterium]|jgi:rhodanese-related sulfurtransferase